MEPTCRKIKTNLKTLVSLLLTRPQESQGCQKMHQDLNLKLEGWVANMDPKLHNLWKTVKKTWFFDDFFFSFDRVFWSFFNLGCILAHQSPNLNLMDPFASFDTPGIPGSAPIVKWTDFESIRPLWTYYLLITFWTLGICFKCCTIMANNECTFAVHTLNLHQLLG